MRASPPKLSADGDPAAGHVQLSWTTDVEGAEFQLQEAAHGDFSHVKMRYDGPNTASVLSGLPNGTRFYRVRERASSDAAWSGWSNPVRFEVHHHPLALALGLCGIGALVFVASAGFLFIGTRKADHG